jgi:glycosyltransferase involved in cell wall biosynthesis
VRTLEKDNTELRDNGLLSRARLFVGGVWSQSTFGDTRTVIREFRPDIVHVHNWLSLVSPSVFHAAWAEGVAVVHTLHNYRLVCPAATLYRDGRVCEDCIGGSMWPGILHACFSTRRTGYRRSRQATIAVASMVQMHRLLHTWQQIDAYIAVSEFVKRKVVAGGLPADRVHVKPNFVEWNQPIRSDAGEYALYVGRLAPEKGVRTLVRAWIDPKGPRHTGLPLKIAGTGLLDRELRELIQASDAPVTMLGQQSRSAVEQLLLRARFVVAPSECYDAMSIAGVEAMAAGVPLLASRIGGYEEMIQHGVSGIHFVPGDLSSLVAGVRMLTEDLEANIRMGQAARQRYLERYTPEHSHQRLLEVYRQAQRAHQV